MQAYSDPKRENEPHALPDVEVWRHNHEDSIFMVHGTCVHRDEDSECLGTGWYWWTCLPGCLPDSEPFGPFETEAAALADAQDGMDDDDLPASVKP